MGEKLKYKAVELRKNLEGCLSAPRARKIAGAYVDGRPFSVVLAASVMRQTRFTEKMRQLGWLSPKFFNSPDNVRTLGKCLMRYYGFLTLVPDIGSFSVPTLDVDLVWHTHQLSPKAYRKDCSLYVGKFVNHDDQVGESFLSDGFELTCRAWESRFGTPYTNCGCALPGATFGETLRRLRKRVLSQRARADSTDHRGCRSSTHPSDHNSVPVDPRVRKERREAWKLRWQRRRNRDGKKTKNPKDKSKDRDLEEEQPRGQDQEAPIAIPLPLMQGYGYPFESSEYPALYLEGVAGYVGDECSLGGTSNGSICRYGSCTGSCGSGGCS